MGGKYCNNLSRYLSVWIVVLLVFTSSITAQQQTKKKSIISAFGMSLLGGAVMGVGALAAGPGQFPYVIPFFSLGVVTGSTLGIWLWDKNDCSPTSTFLGAIVPPIIGAVGGSVIAVLIAGRDEMLLGAGVGLFFGSCASPIGATIGYAKSRSDEQSESQALLYIKHSKLQIGFPSPMFKTILSLNKRTNYECQIQLCCVQF